MEEILAEMPLTIFTMLVPFATGAFVALFVWLLCADEATLRRGPLAKAALIPLGVVLAAFVAAFFHLTNPLHAPFVLFGLGRSPMTNEIIGGIAFAVCAVLFIALAYRSRASVRILQVVCGAAAAVGLGFSWLMGSAYHVPTVTTWANPLLAVAAVGECLSVGVVLGVACLRAVGLLQRGGVESAGAGDGAPGGAPCNAAAFRTACALAVGFGAVLSIGCLIAWFLGVGEVETPFASGAALCAEWLPAFVCGIGLLGLAGVLGVGGVLRLGSARGAVVVWSAVACGLTGVFLSRVVFYALRISVGL